MSVEEREADYAARREEILHGRGMDPRIDWRRGMERLGLPDPRDVEW